MGPWGWGDPQPPPGHTCPRAVPSCSWTTKDGEASGEGKERKKDGGGEGRREERGKRLSTPGVCPLAGGTAVSRLWATVGKSWLGPWPWGGWKMQGSGGRVASSMAAAPPRACLHRAERGCDVGGPMASGEDTCDPHPYLQPNLFSILPSPSAPKASSGPHSAPSSASPSPPRPSALPPGGRSSWAWPPSWPLGALVSLDLGRCPLKGCPG